jgi:NADH-quinone oxidoreductase subunit L
MKGDPRFSRFFAYLSLFLFSMFGLVLANNFFMIFIFWELVGLTSYLLIGFYFEKKSAGDAGKKAFITNRVGDFGFIIGLMMVAYFCGTFNYQGVFDHLSTGAVPTAIITAMGVFLFCGAIGKSAQFPLHVWLPDAMEGPTPVSALIHAATMVVAGVYMVARTMNIFAASADASMVVAVIGVVTSLMAASIGLVQNDIKRVLAYSTVSQLGYMIMALGLYGYDTALGHHSPGYYAGTFHLFTHAFFKGLLFLGAGSVIHAVHTNDIREMGGLFPKMKITAITFMVASVAIAGIPPFSGFFSKDEIIATTLHHPVFMALTLIIAFMTAFYMWRLCFMTFFGRPRDQHRFDHAHESPKSMTYPLIFLAVLSFGSGWFGWPGFHGFGSFVFHGGPYLPHWNILLVLVGTAAGASGIYLAYLMYYKKTVSADAMAEKFRPLHTLLYNKYYFDEIYQFCFIDMTMAVARYMWIFDARVIDGMVNGTGWLTMRWSDVKMWFDKWIVDGAVNGVGWIVTTTGVGLRFLQSGSVQFYTLFALVIAIIAVMLKYLNRNVEDGVGWGTLLLAFAVGTILMLLFGRSTSGAGVSADKVKQEE